MRSLLLALLLPLSALAGSYISPTGSDLSDCLSALTACRTVQHAADIGGDVVSVQAADGTYTSGLNAINYKRVAVIGNCASPTSVIFSTPSATAFQAQDHAIITVTCAAINAAGGVAMSSRQFAIMDYDRVTFGAASVHVSATEMSKINCQSVTVAGPAVYHIAASGISTVSATCPHTFVGNPSFSSFSYAVQHSLIVAIGATFSGAATSTYQYINDASLIVGASAFPGSGGICQNGCILE